MQSGMGELDNCRKGWPLLRHISRFVVPQSITPYIGAAFERRGSQMDAFIA